MKMINSTRTTSTSGVTLISECRSEPDTSLLSCMTSVSLRLGADALGDQPHPVEAGLLDGEHGLPDFAQAEARVGPDHDLGVRIVARRGAQAFLETVCRERLIVDPQPAGLVDRDPDPAPLPPRPPPPRP